LEVSQRMRSGRLKIFPSLSKYLAERRLYRRDENVQVVKERDNLQDATRCLVLGLAAMQPAIEIDPDPEPFFTTSFAHGPGAWMA
jgi:hypothetical protein